MSDPGLTEATQIVARSRQTHVEWADFWRRHPEGCTAEHCKIVEETAGDLDHHLEFIAGYDKVLAALARAAREDVADRIQQARADQLCVFHAGVVEACIDKNAHLTRREQKRLRANYASQCTPGRWWCPPLTPTTQEAT